jgi:hypothetical protein
MWPKSRRRWSTVVLLILVVVVLTACGGDDSRGMAQRTADGALDVAVRYMPQINLPRVVLRYDETGVPSIFGVKTSSLNRIVPLGFLELPPDTVQSLVQADIQHVEFDVDDAGVFIYVNGKSLPYVAWNEDELAYTGQLIDSLNVVENDETIAKVLPLVGRIGIDAAATFPRPEGAEEIPLRAPSERDLATQEEVAADQTATIQAAVQYADNGVPRVANITTQEIGQLAGIDLSTVELPPATLDMLQVAGIERAAIVSRPDGLYILVNEQEVLQLAYNQRHLMNAIDLYGGIAADQDAEALTTLLSNVVPMIAGADIDLVFEFPTAE